jgi:hypothetical protein
MANLPYYNKKNDNWRFTRKSLIKEEKRNLVLIRKTQPDPGLSFFWIVFVIASKSISKLFLICYRISTNTLPLLEDSLSLSLSLPPLSTLSSEIIRVEKGDC